jgi:succinate dehydrogenase / fumarate reductase cytochrome b subunit
MASVDTPAQPGKQRPLSPHLQVYSPLINMVMSIVHRITGVALYAGTLLLAWWLVAAASGPDYFAFVNGLFGSPVGLLVLAGYTWAFLHHLLGGLRHLVWDTGRGFALGTVNLMSWGTLIGSLAITGGIWAWALKAKGLF